MSIAVTLTSATAKTTRRVAIELRALILLIACSATLLQAPRVGAAQDDARLRIVRDPSGEGFVVPGTGWWLGGDVTVVGAIPERSASFVELDDVSLLIRYEPAPRLAFFNETRLESTLTYFDDAGFQQGSAEVFIERLYADVLLSPHLTLRTGKFFTPFGLWNVIRRAPLTWTVEAPAVTEETFPQHATGLSLVYQATWQGWSFDAIGYGPAQDELALRHTSESGLMAGGRVAVGRSLGIAYGALGLNGAAFEQHDTESWANAFGADLDVTFLGNLLTAEFDYANLRGAEGSREFGFYIQDAVPITDTLYGVLRVEQFSPASGGLATGGLTGLFWRPLPYVILKADYQFGDRIEDVMEPGFFASVSLFF